MMKRLVILCLAIVGWISETQAQEIEIKKWYVADAKIACQLGDAMTSCLRIRESEDSNWVNFPWTIEGFTHEKGFEYYIEVSQQKLKFTEMDGPKFTYALSTIIYQKSTVHIDKRILANNTFQIINIEQYGKKTLALKAKPYVKFDLDSNVIYGFSGCNSFMGSCSYATAFMQFGTLTSTLISCNFDDIESKINAALKGKATFYARNNMLYIVCENFMTLHCRPDKRLDSILNVIELEKQPKNDINFMKNEDGSYRVNAPAMHANANLFFMYRPAKLTEAERKKLKYKLLPIGMNPEITMVEILNKENEKPDMLYAIITYKDGSKREMEIRDAN
jgi:heat shock protein HslJ